MVIDFKADSDHARQYMVADAETGVLIRLPIVFADDDAGVLRHLDVEPVIRTGRPTVYRHKGEIEERRPIRVVHKDEIPAAAWDEGAPVPAARAIRET